MLIAIVGAGTVGTEIAQAVALTGEPVILCDSDEKTLRVALGHISRGVDHATAAGTLDSFTARRAKRAFRVATDLIACAGAEVVIEAVYDRLDTKQTVLRTLDGLVRPNTLLATTTNLFSITTLAAATRLPERLIGLHFCRPVDATRLVEIVRTPIARQDLLDQAAALIRRTGRTPLLVPDTPGLVVNRLTQTYIGEALHLLDSGGGLDEQTLDQLMEAAGFPQGPFRLMDETGIDRVLEIAQAIYEATFHSPRYRPHPRQRRMVAAGLLGRRSARGGFYPNGKKVNG